jgi:sec-independent protein translocase protein TatB
MFDIGFGELAVICIVFIIAVGPEKLPAMMKTMGKTKRTLRQASRDIRTSTGIDELLRDDMLDMPAARRQYNPPPGPVLVSRVPSSTVTPIGTPIEPVSAQSAGAAPAAPAPVPWPPVGTPAASAPVPWPPVGTPAASAPPVVASSSVSAPVQPAAAAAGSGSTASAPAPKDTDRG